MAPPHDREILVRYAKALGLLEGSDEWYCFFDLAAADRGIIPQDLMEETEVVKHLPASSAHCGARSRQKKNFGKSSRKSETAKEGL